MIQFIEQHPWFTAFVAGVIIFYGWLAWELKHAPIMDDEDENY